MSGMPHETIQVVPMTTRMTDPWSAVFAPLPESRFHHTAMNARADAVNKIGVMADYVAEIYHAYAEASATQLIYCETVVVYAEIRRQLVVRGVPAAEIAFIQDYDTKTKKAALYAALNSGRLRVLLASKQSTGMNIQQRLIALHHLDCPWRPGDLEQREGRIVRQGNRFPEVIVCAYVTEGSFDGFSWQTVETKATFIEQMKRGDVSVREMDDIGDAVLSASEIKAIASGNPLVMAKVKLDMEVQKLEAGQSGDRDNRVRMRRTIANNELERQRILGRIPFLAAAQAQAEATAADEFKAAILDGVMAESATAYTKRDAAGEALIKVLGELDALTHSTRERQARTVGRYRGFELKSTTSTIGEPDLQILFADDGTALLVGLASPKSTTGVFQSIAYVINHIGDEIGRVQTRLTELDDSDASCAKLLAEPWPQETHLTELRERRDRINAELSASGDVTKKHPAAPTTDDTTSDRAETPSVDGFVVLAESDADHIDTTPIAWIPWEIERPAVLLPTPDDREAMAAALRALHGVEAAPAPAEEPVEELSAEPIAFATIEAVAPAPTDVLDMPPATLAIPARPTKMPALVFGARMPTITTKKAKPAPTHAVRTVRMADVQQMDLFGNDMPHAAMPHTDSGPAQISMF